MYDLCEATGVGSRGGLLPFTFADLSQRVDGGQRCRLDETPDAALARSDESRDTSRQQAIVQMARKLMRQLMQRLEESSTAWDSTLRARGDGGDRGERLSA
jgi:hypothetical protein